MKRSLTFRTYLSVLLVALCVLLLLACGGDDSTSSSSSSSSTPASSSGTSVAATPAATVLISGAKEQYCKARDGFKASLEQVKTLNTKSSIDDVKQINANIKASWSDLKASAKSVADLKLDDLDQSVSKLQSAIDNLGQNASITAILASVAVPAYNVVQDASKVDLDRPCST